MTTKRPSKRLFKIKVIATMLVVALLVTYVFNVSPTFADDIDPSDPPGGFPYWLQDQEETQEDSMSLSGMGFMKALDTLPGSFTVKYIVLGAQQGGYKLATDPFVAPTTAQDGDVITVPYVKDASQTRGVTYTVKYTRDGVEVEADTYEVTKQVWINAPEDATVSVDTISAENDRYIGYKLEADPFAAPTTAQDGDVITVPYEAVLYMVVYNANYGANAHYDDIGSLQRYLDVYSVKTLAATGIKRSGYTFTGWYTTPSDAGTKYNAGNTFEMPAHDEVLFARWTRNAGVVITAPPARPITPTPQPIPPDPRPITPTPQPIPPDPQPPQPLPFAIGEGWMPLTVSEAEPIMPEPVPASPSGAWALLNLMLTLITGLVTVALLAIYFVKRRDDKDEAYTDRDEEEEKVRKHLGLRLLTIVATVIAAIIFIKTQDMSLPMAYVDRWSILHVLIAAATVLLANFSKKDYEEDEEEEAKAIPLEPESVFE